jgi:hypothetical protein
MSRGRNANLSWAVVVIATLAVMGLVYYLTFVAPRPYFMSSMDSEQDYYYNARLIAAGLPVSTHHPGTPIQYLGYLLLLTAGDGLQSTQQFFTLSYVVIAVLTGAGLLATCALILRRYPPGVTTLALAVTLAWAPFLSYLNFFNADSFIVAAGLPTVALFWRAMEGSSPPRWVLVTGGAGIGLCLAIKMSFVPLAVALLAGYGAHALLTIRREGVGGRTAGTLGRMRRALAPLFLGGAVAYAVATAPVIARVPGIWYRTLTRPDTAPQGGGVLSEFGKTLGLIARAEPLWLLVVGVAAAVAVVGFGRALRRRGLAGAASPAPDLQFDLISSGLFLVLLLAAFIYTGAAAVPITPGAELGVHLRNMSPVALGAPFLILYGYESYRSRRPAGRPETWWTQGILAAIGVAVVVMSAGPHLRERRQFIAQHRATIEATEHKLASMARGAGRIAFWTEASEDFMGEASFHLWGNYRYANQAFDSVLLRWFPDYTLFRLRYAGHLALDSLETSGSRYGRIGDLYWAIRRWVFQDREDYSRLGPVIAGGDSVAISAIAFPEDEMSKLEPMSEAELSARVGQWFGVPRVSRESVGGVPWLFFRFDSAQRFRGPPGVARAAP